MKANQAKKALMFRVFIMALFDDRGKRSAGGLVMPAVNATRVKFQGTTLHFSWAESRLESRFL
ncbi:MAG: hypothetical protein HOP33_04915 [Verrucomicrobia bacterium]|nr:hypothetical protein [Verrucomicrobiota bacterium]